jgi:hypothetical protein
MASKVKPTDVTGRAREEQVAANAEALAERAGEMSMATATSKAKLVETIDATVPDRQTVIVESTIEVGGSKDDKVEIRVIEDIENMTLGAGNNYTFKAGQKYAVTKTVAQHLKEKGYLAGVI